MRQRRLISFDWAMKKLLRSKANFEILEGFLSELLKEEIQILEVLESESNQEHRLDKMNRVDLRVKNQKEQQIIIEVQYEREYDYLQRILFGTSKVVTEHMHEGHPYSQVVKVISVNILYFDLGQGQDYVYWGKTTFEGLHHQDPLCLSEKEQHLYQTNHIEDVFPEYYLLKVNQFDDVARDTLDEWIYFLKNGAIKEEFQAKGLKKAKKQLDILQLTETERRAYEHHQNELHYQASMVESAYIEREERKKEREERKKERKEGKEEGRKEGELQKALVIAKELIGLLEIPIIAQKTGLTESEIQALES